MNNEIPRRSFFASLFGALATAVIGKPASQVASGIGPFRPSKEVIFKLSVQPDPNARKRVTLQLNDTSEFSEEALRCFGLSAEKPSVLKYCFAIFLWLTREDAKQRIEAASKIERLSVACEVKGFCEKWIVSRDKRVGIQYSEEKIVDAIKDCFEKQRQVMTAKLDSLRKEFDRNKAS